jgi:hypothetical protein
MRDERLIVLQQTCLTEGLCLGRLRHIETSFWRILTTGSKQMEFPWNS